MWTTEQWENHKKHRTHTINHTGQWAGLLNENGEPIIGLPPITDLTAPETRNAPASLQLTTIVKSRAGTPHQILNELIADGIGKTTNIGELQPQINNTRFIAIERKGMPRRVYWVTHVVAKGGADSPSTLTIHGADMLKLLSRFPCMSAPTTWNGGWTRFQRDWAGPENIGVTFRKPRELKGIKMVVFADGATMQGPAESLIRRVISESLTTAYKAVGVSGDFPIQVSTASSGIASPQILLRPTDKNILDEIMGPAMSAGVRITARMWFPTDTDSAPVGLRTPQQPTIIIDVLQGELHYS
ncbi:MAG: hypothetical protein Q4A82_01115 [Corynebacterium sp.]|nr:hypothetical protein [Corynebacterium sp.]